MLRAPVSCGSVRVLAAFHFQVQLVLQPWSAMQNDWLAFLTDQNTDIMYECLRNRSTKIAARSLNWFKITFSSHTVEKYVANYAQIYIIYFKKKNKDLVDNNQIWQRSSCLITSSRPLPNFNDAIYWLWSNYYGADTFDLMALTKSEKEITW